MSAAITHILDAGGPVARALGPDYEPRQPQLRMTEAVAAAMEARETLLVEAGTGVGKSFAYLVPAIDRCLSRGETVVVATNTIALQEQLMERDIPLLQSTSSTLLQSTGPTLPSITWIGTNAAHWNKWKDHGATWQRTTE